jgi:hypothetical protein
MDRVGKKRIRCSNDGPNIQIVLPVFNCDMESVSSGIQLSDNRFHGPIPIAVNDIPGVTASQ